LFQDTIVHPPFFAFFAKNGKPVSREELVADNIRMARAVPDADEAWSIPLPFAKPSRTVWSSLVNVTQVQQWTPLAGERENRTKGHAEFRYVFRVCARVVKVMWSFSTRSFSDRMKPCGRLICFTIKVLFRCAPRRPWQAQVVL